MKAKVLRKRLSEALDVVARVAASRATLPITEHVLLRVEQDRIELACTDLGIGIVVPVSAKVEEEGAITVPVRLFAEFVKQIDGDQVEFATNDETRTLKVDCGNTKASIKGLDPREFPAVEVPSDGVRVSVVAHKLKTAISQVAFAAVSDDPSRPALTGIAMHVDGDLTIAAADGFRLSVRGSIPAGDDGNNNLNVIVPKRAMTEVARAIRDLDGGDFVYITISGSKIVFECGLVTIVSQLLDGVFPDYNQIVPTKHTTSVIVGAKDLLRATRQCMVFARDSCKIGRIVVEDGKLRMSSASAETGDSEVAIDAGTDGELVDIALNVDYVKDVANAATSANLLILFNSRSDPVVFKEDGCDDYTYVVMPMYLQQREE
jgi:DNA polymerase-3 subunit beta